MSKCIKSVQIFMVYYIHVHIFMVYYIHVHIFMVYYIYLTPVKTQLLQYNLTRDLVLFYHSNKIKA